ncbi:LysR family transcriptional regulator [Labrenzia sp. OB1]|uniref:LysR family transcriptional regulator n=1 Tax=Labrenzia sp. OB1 TaxID=1561204 RepID=UPI0007B2AD97|nr:LysR family transcriptional regulator [Labrenzia sp. OB1]KZM51671.1 LysR family transcriptional regulator [Labrenzia sp. OB1]
MNEPSLRQIRYFIAVANMGQVSRAAVELNVSQSAVTTAIKHLEDIVGVPLFDRHAGGMTLTFEGNIFLDHGRRVTAAVQEAVQSPRRSRETVKGTLRLAMTYTVAGYYIPPYLERFSQAFPRVKLQLTEAPRTAIEDGLVSGTFDLAVMLTSNILDQEGLAYDTLLQSRRRLWVSSQHPLLERPSVSLSDVANEPYIMLTVDEASNTAQRYWNRTSYRPGTKFRTSSVEAVRSMVAGGMGVTILSDMVYRPWSLDGRRVEVISLSDAIPTMDVGLAWAASIDQQPAVAAFREFMHLGEEQHVR